MYLVEPSLDQNFWSEHYCGRQIAAFNHYNQWHVYLDDVYQHNKVFATAEHARKWLIDRINGSASIARSAEPLTWSNRN
jgi:hypothetical protein